MKRNIHFLSVVKCKHLFSILLVIPVCSHAGFYDCEREMTVNVFNQAPFSEDVARAAGWTKMPDWKSFYHIEGTWTEVAEKMAQKQAILMILDSISGGSMSEVAKTMVSDALDVSLNINHKYISPDGKNEAVFSPDKKLVNQGPLQGTYNQIPPDANWIEHMKSSILPHVSCVLNGNFEWEPTKNCFIVDKTGNKQSVDCETGEPNSLGNGFSSPVFQTPDGVVNLSFANETVQNTVETDSGILNKDVLHTLADLLETGEEIVEVREDMREDRRERKAKEQAERERKAAEEERLRQQLLAEQRRKAQSEQQKKKKKDKKLEQQKDGTPATTTPAKTPSKVMSTVQPKAEPLSSSASNSPENESNPQQPRESAGYEKITIDVGPIAGAGTVLENYANNPALMLGAGAKELVQVEMSAGDKWYREWKAKLSALPDGHPQKAQAMQFVEQVYSEFCKLKAKF